MNFPHIEHIDELMSKVSSKPEFGIVKQDNGTQVVSYFIATSESFNDEWSRECRGITFGQDGKIISRPLHKFFNVNEREETQIDKIDWSKVTRVMDKRDGSMINTALVNGRLSVKTKRSFKSDVAVKAQMWFDLHSNYIDFARELSAHAMTPTFEYTSPSNRIVLPYESDEMTLLHVRYNVSGEYISQVSLEMMSEDFDIKLVDTVSVSDMLSFVRDSKEVKGVEGWVIQFEDGNMVKLKTEEYLVSHRVITFVRERDIAELVLDEKLDDLTSALVERKISLDKVREVEHRVLTILREIEVEVRDVYELNKNLSRKDFVEAVKGKKTFGLLMQQYSYMHPGEHRGEVSEPNFAEFFRKNYLKQEFGLTSI